MKEKVHSLLDSFFQERQDLFLADCTVSSANAIHICIDGDSGVSLQDCLDLSRHIEGNLDREEEDFSLEVSSPGATEPMRMPRQYLKNTGRKILVRLHSKEELEGTLKEVNESGILLHRKYRKPKDIGKGKVTVEEDQPLSFQDIDYAVVKLQF